MREECGCLTLAVWFQLGELRLFSVGEISDNGRGIELAILVGDDMEPFLDRRRGCTCANTVLEQSRSEEKGSECIGEDALLERGEVRLNSSSEAMPKKNSFGPNGDGRLDYCWIMPREIFTAEWKSIDSSAGRCAKVLKRWLDKSCSATMFSGAANGQNANPICVDEEIKARATGTAAISRMIWTAAP